MSSALHQMVEGDAALPPGTALDIGCGTGDNAIYLAKHGWHVTGVDYVERALAAASDKAAAAGVSVNFVKADATSLRASGVAPGFSLIVDNGCLHGMSDEDRDAYVREVTAVAATDARLLIVAFVPGSSFGVPGIAPADVERRFGAHWKSRSSGNEDGARFYVFERAL
jgi:ubiquinone/menaquinone biosynthesis C-methylase UbiE